MELSLARALRVGQGLACGALLAVAAQAWHTMSAATPAAAGAAVGAAPWQLGGATLLLVGALAALAMARRRFEASLSRLLAAFEAVEAGDLAHRIPVLDTGDRGRIVQAFNRMAARLQEVTSQQARTHAGTADALQRLDRLAEVSGLGAWRWVQDGDGYAVDARYARLLGETPESFGSTLPDFVARVHPDDVEPLFDRTYAHLANPAEPLDIEYRMRHRDGSWRWVATLGLAVERDADGGFMALSGMLRDVTALRGARIELEAQRRVLDALAGNLPGLLHRLRAAHDGQLSFDFVGRGARALLGIDADQLSIDAFVALLTPQTAAASIAALRAAIAARRDAEIEYEVQLPDGRRRWLRCIARFVATDRHGATWDGVLVDISDEVARRHELEAARRAAERADEAKSAFLASMSHELRTPLTGILGYAQLIELRTTDDRVRPLAATVRTSAERMRALLDEVLDAAKVEAGAMAVELAPAPLVPLLREAAELFLPAIEARGLALRLDLGEGDGNGSGHGDGDGDGDGHGTGERDVFARCDPQRVRQVLANLLSNAVKFTVRGGVTLSLRADETTVRIRVADTGPGVPPGFRPALFQRFSQAGEQQARHPGGTGLGLALSRDFARLMGGDLVLAEPGTAADGPQAAPTGTGATFELTLQRALDTPRPCEPAVAG